jgi:hypothetical protein
MERSCDRAPSFWLSCLPDAAFAAFRDVQLRPARDRIARGVFTVAPRWFPLSHRPAVLFDVERCPGLSIAIMIAVDPPTRSRTPFVPLAIHAVTRAVSSLVGPALFNGINAVVCTCICSRGHTEAGI